MKKVLLLIITTGFIITTYSQKIDTLPIPDTAKLTLSKVYSDVKSGLIGLSESLKVPATHVYKILVKQQLANSISYLSLVLIFVICSIVLYRLSSKNYNAHLKYCLEKQNDKDPDIWDSTFSIVSIVCAIMSGITFIVSIVCFCSYFNEIIVGFTNPEYGAIKEIISFVK